MEPISGIVIINATAFITGLYISFNLVHKYCRNNKKNNKMDSYPY